MHRKDRDIEEQKGIHELRGLRKPEMVQEESTSSDLKWQGTC